MISLIIIINNLIQIELRTAHVGAEENIPVAECVDGAAGPAGSGATSPIHQIRNN